MDYCKDCGPLRDCDCTFTCSVCEAVSIGHPNHPEGICPDAASLQELADCYGWEA